MHRYGQRLYVITTVNYFDQPVGNIQGLTQSRVAVKGPGARAGHATRKHIEKGPFQGKALPNNLGNDRAGPPGEWERPGHEPALLTARPWVGPWNNSNYRQQYTPRVYVNTTMAHCCRHPHARFTPHAVFPQLPASRVQQ